MRVAGRLFFAFLALVVHNPAFADSTVDYSAGFGRTSNLFQDTSRLSASYGEAKLGLRGSLDLEGGKFAYGLSVSTRRVPAYRFADQRNAGVELGYAADLSDAVKLTLKGGIEHRGSGDLFLKLPGVIVGYRSAELAAVASAGLSVAHGGGKSHGTVSFTALRQGRAYFTLPGVIPARLEADTALLDVSGGHIRPLMGGEVGLTLQYRHNGVPLAQRERYERFPAQTLRGSLAYGRRFGDSVTLLAEIGAITVDSAYLGTSVRKLRPFLKGELSWQPLQGWKLTAKGGQETRLADIDDPLGEYVRSLGLSVEKSLTERLKAGLGYEQARSEWLYYAYHTRTDSLAASLTYSIDKKNSLTLEYGRLVRRESDARENFRTHSLSARLAGSF